MPTLSGLQMNTWTDSLALKLLSNYFELYSECFELYNYGLDGRKFYVRAHSPLHRFEPATLNPLGPI